MPSIPLQSIDYAALPQKDLYPHNANDDDDHDDGNSALSPPPQSPTSPYLAQPPSSNGPPTRRRLSTLGSIAAAPWIVHALLVLVNAFTFAYVMQMRRAPSEEGCARRLSEWSPALDAHVIHYKLIPLTSSNSPPDHPPTTFTGAPLNSPALDAAWSNISTSVPKLRLDTASLARLKKNPGDVAPAPAVGERGAGQPSSLSPGGKQEKGKNEEGEEEEILYQGQLAVYELLGCLDTLRKAAAGDRAHYFPDGMGEQDEERVERCVEVLRGEVMCACEVGVVTYKQDGEGVDWAGVRKCRGFDEVLGWSWGVGGQARG